ncbi:MAG: methyltransferase domain-containing protein [Myxococcales bacterium]|nr:methyltransferase domain-containing protein [Myxococcales bacterium]
MTQEGAALWSQHASAYDALFSGLTGYVAKGMLRIADPRMPPGTKVLDIAAGTGALAIPALERSLANGGADVIVASDWSEGMLAFTERRAKALGATSAQLRCEVQNGEALTYESASFDAVFSCFGIFLFGDRRAGWREAARVLRSGGTFLASVWQSPATNPMLREQMAPMGRALPERFKGPPPKGSWLEVSEAEPLAREVRECGAWRSLDVLPFHASIAFGDWSKVWGAMLDNPVSGALLRQCDDREREAVRVSVFDHFRSLAGGDDRPLVLEAVCNIVVATKA